MTESKYPDLYYTQADRKGRCCFRLKQYERAIESYREVLEWNGDRLLCLKAKLNIAGCYLATVPDAQRETILQTYGEARAEIGSLDISTRERNGFRVVVAYNLARAHVRFGNRIEARRELATALEWASSEESAILLHEMALMSEKDQDKRELLRKSVDTIVAERLRVVTSALETTLDFDDMALAGILASSFEVDEDESFNRLFDYCLEDRSGTNSSAIARAFEILISLTAGRGAEPLKRIGARIVNAAERAGDGETAFTNARLVAYHLRTYRTADQEIGDYLRLLSTQPKTRPLDRVDILSLAGATGIAIGAGRLSGARSIVELAEGYRGATGLGDYLILEYYGMQLAGAAGDKVGEAARAREVLRIIASEPRSALLRENHLDAIRSDAARVTQAGEKLVPYVRSGRRIGRNEYVVVRYKDGRKVEAKFKRVENDLRVGHCELVRNDGP